ncbi:MAG: hypothetical protein JJ975_13180 [Bacteroidia bacterium]|nr:hypothetical protein [Bacteroidia bacterium]
MNTRKILTGQFDPVNHWYPKSLNATIHPMVNFFMNLSKDQLIQRYCHLHPLVHKDGLREILSYKPKHYRLAGTDLIHVTTERGMRQMVVIENNSCPSGQKSMPLLDDYKEQGGYRVFVDETIKAALRGKRMISGCLAVLYDKNPMEASGYAAALADSFDEPVYLVPFYQNDENPDVRVTGQAIEIRTEEGAWLPARMIFRYLTQRPWNRLPISTRTIIFNPIICCLAGGRNKMVGAKAYDLYNAQLEGTGLKIITPETIWDVSKEEIPLWVAKMGGKAVIKIPYSNAGQGVFTIVNQKELDAFMEDEYPYDQFIVQSLIGNYQWSSVSAVGRFYHVGTVPGPKGRSFAADFRMMIHATDKGYRPLSVYGRRAKTPLSDQLEVGDSSWDMLGTNLSFKDEKGGWDSETARLLLMDRRDFNRLGIGLDDLVDGYIQAVLSTIAIDKMACQLLNAKGQLKMKLFRSLNNDPSLIEEILIT